MDVLRTCSRGGLLFGAFLLATQEKVTRAPEGAEKDMDVNASKAKDTGFRIAPAARACPE
jgi:hypothetical protein